MKRASPLRGGLDPLSSVGAVHAGSERRHANVELPTPARVTQNLQSRVRHPALDSVE